MLHGFTNIWQSHALNQQEQLQKHWTCMDHTPNNSSSHQASLLPLNCLPLAWNRWANYLVMDINNRTTSWSLLLPRGFSIQPTRHCAVLPTSHVGYSIQPVKPACSWKALSVTSPPQLPLLRLGLQQHG